jgi:hypothetical protein
VIPTAEREPAAVIAEVETWIEAEMLKLPPANAGEAAAV